MSGPADPPIAGLTIAAFDAVHSYTFNAAGGYWTDTQGNHVFLIACSGALVGGLAWMLDKPASFPNNPYGPATATLAKVLANGTRNSDGTVAYLGTNYGIVLKRNSSGTDIVDAAAS